MKTEQEILEAALKIVRAEYEDAVRSEFEHAWDLINHSPCQKTKLHAMGHAQCAVSIMMKLGINDTEMMAIHAKMARLFGEEIAETPVEAKEIKRRHIQLLKN